MNETSEVIADVVGICPTVTLMLIHNTHPNLSDDLSDLRLKAHVQHAISFVNDEVSRSTQVGLIVLKQVYQAAWCRYTDLSSCYTPSRYAMCARLR